MGTCATAGRARREVSVRNAVRTCRRACAHSNDIQVGPFVFSSCNALAERFDDLERVDNAGGN